MASCSERLESAASVGGGEGAADLGGGREGAVLAVGMEPSRSGLDESRWHERACLERRIDPACPASPNTHQTFALSSLVSNPPGSPAIRLSPAILPPSSAAWILASLSLAPAEKGSFEPDEVGDGRSEVTWPSEVLIPGGQRLAYPKPGAECC